MCRPIQKHMLFDSLQHPDGNYTMPRGKDISTGLWEAIVVAQCQNLDLFSCFWCWVPLLASVLVFFFPVPLPSCCPLKMSANLICWKPDPPLYQTDKIPEVEPTMTVLPWIHGAEASVLSAHLRAFGGQAVVWLNQPSTDFTGCQNKQNVLNVTLETDIPPTTLNKSELAEIALFICLCLFTNIDMSELSKPSFLLWFQSGGLKISLCFYDHSTPCSKILWNCSWGKIFQACFQGKNPTSHTGIPFWFHTIRFDSSVNILAKVQFKQALNPFVTCPLKLHFTWRLAWSQLLCYQKTEINH